MSDEIKEAEAILRFVVDDGKKGNPKLTDVQANRAYVEAIAFSLLDIAKSLEWYMNNR